MTLTHKIFPRRPLDGALAATLWFEPNLRELEALKSLLDWGTAPPLPRQGAGRPGPASVRRSMSVDR